MRRHAWRREGKDLRRRRRHQSCTGGTHVRLVGLRHSVATLPIIGIVTRDAIVPLISK